MVTRKSSKKQRGLAATPPRVAKNKSKGTHTDYIYQKHMKETRSTASSYSFRG